QRSLPPPMRSTDVKWPLILPPRNRPRQNRVPPQGGLPPCPAQEPGAHGPGARYFGRPKLRPEKSPRRRTTSRRCSGDCRRRRSFFPLEIVLAKIGCRRRGVCRLARRRSPERMGLTLGILEGQNFTRKNHHGVG